MTRATGRPRRSLGDAWASALQRAVAAGTARMASPGGQGKHTRWFDGTAAYRTGPGEGWSETGLPGQALPRPPTLDGTIQFTAPKRAPPAAYYPSLTGRGKRQPAEPRRDEEGLGPRRKQELTRPRIQFAPIQGSQRFKRTGVVHQHFHSLESDLIDSRGRASIILASEAQLRFRRRSRRPAGR